MSENTSIEWADDSVNFWTGCTHHGTGCLNCYAERLSKRTGLDLWGPRAPRLYGKGAADLCRKLERKAAKDGRPRIVFVNSMSDFFEEHNGNVVELDGARLHACRDRNLRPVQISDLRRSAFEIIDSCPHVNFLLLTKRPENIREMWPARCTGPEDDIESYTGVRHNVWLGTSLSTQADADRQIPELLKCRDLSPVLFLSVEPLIEAVDLNAVWPGGMANGNGPYVPGIDWVIVGGESGPGARPCNVEWIRLVVEQCKETDVPVFVKQLGSRAEEWDASRRKPGFGPFISNGFRHSKGGDPSEWPSDLRIRQMPTLAKEPAR